MTIVAYGAAVGMALDAAQRLASEGVEAEVIDLRSLQPWDEGAVLASLARILWLPPAWVPQWHAPLQFGEYCLLRRAT